MRAILAAEIERYRAERAAREYAPLISSLRQHGEGVRRFEIDRFKSKVDGLDPDNTVGELMTPMAQMLVAINTGASPVGTPCL